MKIFIFALLIISNMAIAEVYKCTINNKTEYRDHPCPDTSQSTIVEIDRAHLRNRSLEGCYSVRFAGYESGSKIEKFKISNKGNSQYTMKPLNSTPSEDLPMKNATQEDLQKISQAFHVNAESGINMNTTQADPGGKPPLGFYRVTDGDGNKVILVYFFITNGIATEISCP
jgi:hypothetical protein